MTYYILHTIFLWALIIFTHRYVVNLITFIPKLMCSYQGEPDGGDYFMAVVALLGGIFALNIIAYVPYLWILGILVLIGFKLQEPLKNFCDKLAKLGKQ